MKDESGNMKKEEKKEFTPTDIQVLPGLMGVRVRPQITRPEDKHLLITKP